MIHGEVSSKDDMTIGSMYMWTHGFLWDLYIPCINTVKYLIFARLLFSQDKMANFNGMDTYGPFQELHFI